MGFTLSEEEATEYLAGDIMRTPVITITPIKTIREAARIMVENDIGSLVVTDDSGRLIGVITKTDILRKVVARGLDPENVMISEVMTGNPNYVFTDTPLEEVAEIMGSKGIGHVPVLDTRNNKPIGMISKRDILRIAPQYMRYALRR